MIDVMAFLAGLVQFRRSTRFLCIAAVVLFIAAGGVAVGQSVNSSDAENKSLFPVQPDIYCFSGSPLLLQVNVPNLEQSLESISIESAACSISYTVPQDLDDDSLQFYINPFLNPGLYGLDVTLRTKAGIDSSSRFEVGFVDFVWGRDNLNFGNNHKYKSVIGTFSEILADWLEARFGELDDSDFILLADYMYGLFGQNTGRCYAFAGTEVRYWRWPELLPSYYKSTHDLRGAAPRYQREMNYLQFDIVFDHFLAGPGGEQIRQAMSRDQIEEQVSILEDRIALGEPVAVGFAGPDLHHSMLVFGYIRNYRTQTVDLLVANNWKNDEKLNIHSRDAEIIRLFLSPDHQGAIMQWRYEDGLRKRDIDRLFVVNVKRDSYEHDPLLLSSLAETLRSQVHTEERVIIVVEKAKGARIVDSLRSTGRIRSKVTQEIEEVWFEKVGETFRFTCPADSEFELEVYDSGAARIMSASPGEDLGDIEASLRVTEATDEGKTIVRRFPIGTP